MANIIDSVRRRFFEKHSKGKVKSVKSGYSQIDDISKAMKREKAYALYESYYRRVPLINATVNYTADMATGVGYHLVSDSESDKKKIEEFMTEFDVATIIHRITKQLLIYGNAYLEIVKTGKRITDLKLLSPKTITIITNEYGDVEEYIQVISNLDDPIKFSPDEIAHFKWNVISDDTYGTSAIAAVVTNVKIKLSMEHDLSLIAHRYAAPQVHYKIGSDDYPAADSAVDEFESDLAEIHPEMDLVTDHTITSEVIRPLGKSIGIESYVDHIENQIIAGMQVPEVVLGRGKGSTEATANVQLAAFDRRVGSLQKLEAKEIETNLFDIIVLAGSVEIVFGQLEKEDEDVIVNRLLRLKGAGVVSVDYVAMKLGINKKWIPEEEPMDDGDDSGDLKGLDDTKKDVKPHKEPVSKKDKVDKKKQKLADSNEQWRLAA